MHARTTLWVLVFLRADFLLKTPPARGHMNYF